MVTAVGRRGGFFDPSQVRLGDDETFDFGDAPDFSVRYDSADDELVWADEVNGDDVMGVNKDGNLAIQGTITESTTV